MRKSTEISVCTEYKEYIQKCGKDCQIFKKILEIFLKFSHIFLELPYGILIRKWKMGKFPGILVKF